MTADGGGGRASFEFGSFEFEGEEAELRVDIEEFDVFEVVGLMEVVERDLDSVAVGDNDWEVEDDKVTGERVAEAVTD